jgi:hypothetical protein
MADTTFPADPVDLQRRVHAAWAAVEAHRKGVDAARRAEAQPTTDPTRRWESPALRPWTPEEDQEHARLMAEATAAATALRAGMVDAGLDGGYDAVQGLHKAARDG